MKSKYTKSYFKLGKNEKDLFDQITFGDLMVGFLFSACNSSQIGRIAFKRAEERRKYQRAFESLKSKNIIYTQNDKIILTDFGKILLKERNIVDEFKFKKEKWDGKWRMIAFDIPQDLSHIRYFLRNFLLQTGFWDMQQSVYFHPYHPKEILDFLKENPDLNKFVIFAEIDNCSFDKNLRKKFKNLI